MSITIDISDEKLREAEEALNIHDPAQLFLSLLDEKLARHAAAHGVASPTAATAGASKSKVWTDEDFERTLAAARHLPDLTDEEFDALEREMNRPLPPAWAE